MNNTKETYRFTAVIITLMMLFSVSLPACLYAYGQMDNLCRHEMKQGHTSPVIPGDHCEMPASSEQSSHHSKSTEAATNCDYIFTCANIQDAPKAEVIPSIVKAKVILSATVLDFTAKLQPVQTPREVPAPNLNSSPPPVFLVNSSFLN